ncbi:MAG: Spy/CpxP family protein refolding chaperone [Gammaproteobacteria bacterium]|nr:Spy/CpxP family protein refolding chaperone [Gammaproteobacteria bacterium]
MKKRNWIISSVLAGSIITIGAVGVTQACGGQGGLFRGDHRGDKMIHVMKGLDLTKEQRQSIRSIRNEQRDKMGEQQDAMMDIRKSLREQAHSDSYDVTKVRELADAKAKIMADMTVQRTETMNRIYKELSPEQRAELDSYKERGFGRGNF